MESAPTQIANVTRKTQRQGEVKMKIEWKMIRKLLLLILIGQISEINSQDLNTIDEASKIEVISQQSAENFDNTVDVQKEKTVAEELNILTNQGNPDEKKSENKKTQKKEKSKNKTRIQEEKTIEQPQASTSVISETIIKHGIEFSISKIISKADLDVQKIISPDELAAVKEQNNEYFNKKYLNKEVVVMGAFDSVSRHDKNYKLKIDKFNPSFFSTSLSCSFSDIEDLKPLIQLLDIDSYYVLVKGIVTSSDSLKNCVAVGVAKFKI